MSEELERKSHAGKWISFAVVTLLAYFLSWPPIEIRCGRKVTVTVDTGYDVVTKSSHIQESGWSTTLYGLPHWIKSCDPEHNPLEKYWLWWCGRMGDPGI